jgi:predicted FMN-binding regulatory protein PaiB
MYVPAHFDESRTEVLHDLITQNPFGTLVTHGKSGLDANHIPFLLNPEEGKLGVLHAHVARVNPVWQDVANGHLPRGRCLYLAELVSEQAGAPQAGADLELPGGARPWPHHHPR